MKMLNNPFRYEPAPAIVSAARTLIRKIKNDHLLSSLFEEGKMMGILLVYRPEDGTQDFLYAFSGNVTLPDHRVTAVIEGFVPPVCDIMAAGSHFQQGQSTINKLNDRLSELESSETLASLKSALSQTKSDAEREIKAYQSYMVRCRQERHSNPSAKSEGEMVSESQFQKAECRRIKKRWQTVIEDKQDALSAFEDQINNIKEERRILSDELQRWIFENYIVMNGLGETASIWDIFKSQGLVPPGGTGDCAAPKLLNYAFRHGLVPMSMGEFWYGKSPLSIPRIEGHFYPSCTSKCGPLLPWMLRGVEISQEPTLQVQPEVIYEDEYILVAVKPSGMLSTPGKTGERSLIEILSEAGRHLLEVHRLDMDTSGLIVFAKSKEVQTSLRKQFESRTVCKTYCARLMPGFKAPDKGRINLPMRPDYDNRPLQIVDPSNGKEAITDYEVIRRYPNGEVDIAFYPVTGRTHQLRVHSAHRLGLGTPIKGDRLYGGSGNQLCLHASLLSFLHPITGRKMSFDCHPSLF